jgi:hypothetical protein
MVTQLSLYEHPRQHGGADGPPHRIKLSNREKKGQKNVPAVGAHIIEELHWLNYNLKHRTHYASSHQVRAWRSRKTAILLTINKK